MPTTTAAVIYGRYSTERQDEVSIEAQIEVCRDYAAKRDWTVVEEFVDRAVSGTRYKTRPGIVALGNHVRRGDIDRIVSVALDRISRDLETSASLYKRFKYWRVELHTVHDGRVDLNLAMKAVLSQELIEQIAPGTAYVRPFAKQGRRRACLWVSAETDLRRQGRAHSRPSRDRPRGGPDRGPHLRSLHQRSVAT